MKVGIIGPNTFNNHSKKELQKRKNNLIRAAEIISDFNFDIVLTPDKNSLLDFFGNYYKNLKKNKIWIVAPMNDDAEKYLNLELGEIIDCDVWAKQPSKFNEETDLLICIGYSCGVLSEIGASKYFNPKKILILDEFIGTKLPQEINQSINIEYISLEKLKDRLHLVIK